MRYYLILLVYLSNVLFPLELGAATYRSLQADFMEQGSSVTRNYIRNSNFETNVNGWATYADAAGTIPVDCTGGAPTLTLTRTTSSPERGSGSGLITKDAANRQGNGASYAFTIDNADQAQPFSIEADYSIASGTYSGGTSSTNSDLIAYVYDVTNSTLIEPAAMKLDGGASGVKYKLKASFQTASNSTSYRLCLHASTTSASAYTVSFDNVQVGPSRSARGPPMTEPVAYTPTFVGFGTPSNVSFYSWRNGKYLFIEGSFTTGTVTGTAASVTLGFQGVNAPGLTIDSGLQALSIVGSAASATVTSSTFAGNTVIASGGGTVLNFGAANSSGNQLSALGGTSIVGNSSRFSFEARVPIAGWGASATLGFDADTRVVAAKFRNTTNFATDSSTPVNYDTKVYDTHAAVTTSPTAWKFVAPVAGYYEISGAFTNASGTPNVFIYKNGSSVEYMVTVPSATLVTSFKTQISLVAGDYIDIRPGSSVTTTGATAGTNYVNIQRISGPSQIAASENVYAYYNGTITGTINGSYNTMTYGTKVSDSHNAYSSGTYTVPVNGTYTICLGAEATATSNTYFILGLHVDGTIRNSITWRLGAGTSSSVTPNGCWTGVYLRAGQAITIKSNTNGTGGSWSSDFGSVPNYFSIAKTGI